MKVERGAGNLDGKLKIAGLSTGRLGNQFANLAGRIAHLNPIVGNLASVLGDFAVGGLVTAGVLAGLAAIAVAYDKFTASSRKAREESDKLTKSLVDQARSQHLATLQGLEDLELEARTKLQLVKKESGLGARSFFETILRGGIPTISAGEAEAQSKRIADAQTAATQAAKNWTDAWAEANKPVKEHTTAVKELGVAVKNTSGNLAAALQIVREWGPMMAALNQGATQGALASLQQSVIGTFQMPKISGPFDDLTDKQKDQLRQLGVLTDHSDKNSEMLKDAIWGSATALANTVVSALNLGGGGRGSSLGGALGATAGFALGSLIPGGSVIGGAIGSTLGNIAGSLIGGLFDNSSATRENTESVRQNTAALILNAPSGFKIASYRYDATDVNQLGRALRRRSTRGGANPF